MCCIEGYVVASEHPSQQCGTCVAVELPATSRSAVFLLDGALVNSEWHDTAGYRVLPRVDVGTRVVVDIGRDDDGGARVVVLDAVCGALFEPVVRGPSSECRSGRPVAIVGSWTDWQPVVLEPDGAFELSPGMITVLARGVFSGVPVQDATSSSCNSLMVRLWRAMRTHCANHTATIAWSCTLRS